MIDFLSLELENFKSFRGKHTISLARYGYGLHYVTGRNKTNRRLGANGAGKTSLWEAIYWILYGKSIKGKPSPSLHTWDAPGGTVGILTLHKNGTDYKITRSWKPGSLSIRKGDDYREIEIVEQFMIDNFIGLDETTFLHTVLIGQKNALFMELPPTAKLEVFETLLKLTEWTERATLAGFEANKLEGRLTGLRQEVASARAALSDLKAQRDGQKGQFSATRVALGEKLAVARSQARTATSKKDKYAAKLERLDIALEKKSGDSEKAAAEAERLDELSTKLRKRFSTIQIERTVVAETVARMTDQIRILSNSRKKCPTCGQAWHGAEEQAKRVRAERQSYDRQLTSFDKKLEKLQNRIVKVEKKRGDAKYSDAGEAASNLAVRAEKLRGFIDKFDTIAKNAESTMRDIKQERARMRAMKAIADEQIAKRREQIKKAKKERDDVEREYTSHKFWVKGFKDIRLVLIDQITAEFSAAMVQNAEELGLTGWELKAVVEKETKKGTIQRGLQIMVKGPHDEESVPYESYSGGEAQRLGLAGTFGLADVILSHAGVDLSMEILDEPTQHMSPEGVEDLLSLLRDRAHENKKQIWFVDHHSHDQGLFDGTMTIGKNKEGSFVL